MAEQERQVNLGAGDLRGDLARLGVTQDELAVRLAEDTGRPKESWVTALGLIRTGDLELSQDAYAWLLGAVRAVAQAQASKEGASV